MIRKYLTRLRPLLQRSTYFRIFDARRGALHSDDIGLVLTDVNGIRFVLYHWDQHSARQMILHGEDRPQYEAMALLVKPGDTVFDVGAHAGFHCIRAALAVGTSGTVYAFEPVPETYWMLRELLVLNRCENVIPIQKAISDKIGMAEMNLFAPHQSVWNSLGAPVMQTLEGKEVRPSAKVTVATETLDHFAESMKIDKIHFLKVDVEGFEKFAFLGAARLLQENRIDFICFEISQAPLKGAGIKANEVFEVLESFGYRSYIYQPESRTFDGPISDSEAHFANYYASRQDLSAREKA